jgi:hypothetical protein
MPPDKLSMSLLEISASTLIKSSFPPPNKSADPNFDATEGVGQSTDWTIVCFLLSKGLRQLDRHVWKVGEAFCLIEIERRNEVNQNPCRRTVQRNCKVGMIDLWPEMEKLGLTLLANSRKRS